MGYPVKLSSSAIPLLFRMISSSDHITPSTGLSPTVTLSKNGDSFDSPDAAVVEVGNGWYQLQPNAQDSNTLGPLLLNASASGADDCSEQYLVVAYDPFDSTRLGMTALPNSAAENEGGLITFGTGSGQLNVTSGCAISMLNGEQPYQVVFDQGIIVNQSNANQAAFLLNGNGTGPAISCVGGSYANGVSILGGDESGHGLYVHAVNQGAGIWSQGAGSADGIVCMAGADGNGICASGGTSSGNGIQASTWNGHGAYIRGSNAGDGIRVEAGSTGHGLEVSGGSSDGRAIYAYNSSGTAVSINAAAGNGLDIWATSGFGMLVWSTNNCFDIFSQNGNAVYLQALNNDALIVYPGSTHNGIHVYGGQSSGDAFKLSTSGTGSTVMPTGDAFTETQEVAILNNVLTALTTAMEEAYAADGVNASIVQMLYEMKQNISECSISGTTKTVKKLDGSTTAATYTLNDATNPTAITRAT